MEPQSGYMQRGIQAVRYLFSINYTVKQWTLHFKDNGNVSTSCNKKILMQRNATKY